MLNTTNQDTPQLQAPGAGLPRHELFIARILVGSKMRLTSHNEANRIFSAEKSEILAIAERFEPELASRPVLIDRLRGMEDSSRNWSLYMTMEHLRIVNRFTIDLIESLQRGVKPRRVASTAAVKPRDGVDNSVIGSFKATCDEFESKFGGSTTIAPTPTYAHPWFGELQAKQWHFFAGFHMNLHKRQMQRIAAKL